MTSCDFLDFFDLSDTTTVADLWPRCPSYGFQQLDRLPAPVGCLRGPVLHPIRPEIRGRQLGQSFTASQPVMKSMGDLQDPTDGGTLVPYFWPSFVGIFPEI